jgi:hypothetical protein
MVTSFGAPARRRRREDYLQKGKTEIPEWVFLSPGKIKFKDGKPVGEEKKVLSSNGAILRALATSRRPTPNTATAESSA